MAMGCVWVGLWVGGGLWVGCYLDCGLGLGDLWGLVWCGLGGCGEDYYYLGEWLFVGVVGAEYECSVWCGVGLGFGVVYYLLDGGELSLLGELDCLFEVGGYLV